MEKRHVEEWGNYRVEENVVSDTRAYKLFVRSSSSSEGETYYFLKKDKKKIIEFKKKVCYQKRATRRLIRTVYVDRRNDDYYFSDTGNELKKVNKILAEYEKRTKLKKMVNGF